MEGAIAELQPLLGAPWQLTEEGALWQCLAPDRRRFALRLERRALDGSICLRLPGMRGLGELDHILFLCLDDPTVLAKLVRNLREAGVKPAPRSETRGGRHHGVEEPPAEPASPDPARRSVRRPGSRAASDQN